MKINISLNAGIVLCSTLFVLTSCKKAAEKDTDAAEDEIIMQRGSEDIFSESFLPSVDCTYGWDTLIGTCVTVTQDSPTFPKVLTLDFGTIGCVDPFGRDKSGKIILDMSDDIRNDDATCVMTFEDFTIENIGISGTRTATNIGESGSSELISVAGDFTATYGTWYITRTVAHQREWSAGSTTCTFTDDEFLITGSGSTVGKYGKTVTHEILEPLSIFPYECGYIKSGQVEIKLGKRGGTVDYGDGTCDAIATFTSFKGDVYTIDLLTCTIVE